MENFNYKKILIMLPTGLGDLVKDLGIVNAIKQNYPASLIDILSTKDEITSIIKYNKNINKAFKVNFAKFTVANYLKYFLSGVWYDLIKLNNEKYELVICLSLNPLRRFILVFLKTQRKIVITQKGSDVSKEYEILDQLSIKELRKESFLNRLNLTALNPNKFVRDSIKCDKHNIVINMFCEDSPNSIRDWDKWSDLIDELFLNYNIILVGRVNFNYKQYYHIDYNKVIDLISTTNIDELIYIIKNSDLVISVDSFVFHLAYALRKKVVGLFGPVDPKMRIPMGADTSKIIAIFKKPKCAPCQLGKHLTECKNKSKPNICMRNISKEEVMAKIKGLITSK